MFVSFRVGSGMKWVRIRSQEGVEGEGRFACTSDHMPYQSMRYYTNVDLPAEIYHLAPLFVLLCNTEMHGEFQ